MGMINTLDHRSEIKPVSLQPILFIHGWWGGPWVWHAYQQFFEHRGYVCHALDLRQTQRETSTCRQSIYRDLATVQAAVRQLDRPILIGHSAGGLLASKVAETAAVSAVIALAPAVPRGINTLSLKTLIYSLRYLPQFLIQRAWIYDRAEMAFLNLNALSKTQQDWVYGQMQPIDPIQVWEVVVRGVPIQPQIFQMPQLIVAGAEDRLTPSKALEATAKYYGADYFCYPNHAHYLMREPGWDIIAEDICSWLQEYQLTSRGSAIEDLEDFGRRGKGYGSPH